MAAVGIVGLAIESAANLRTVLLSIRQRHRHFSDNEKEFNKLVDDLARITENLREIEQRMDSRSHTNSSGHVARHLETVDKRLLACTEVLEELGKGPLQVHSGPSLAHMVGTYSRITSTNRIHEKLKNVSADFHRVDGLLDTVAILLSISEHSRTQGSTEEVDRHLDVSSVPILTHQEVLDFNGKDEDGNLTPEAQLKIQVLSKQNVVAAASTHRAKVPSAQGMAGVGKTVALKGLGSDEDIRKAFDEIHYITLGHDATADTVLSELARIVEISGGERQSGTVLRCKDVNTAVLHTRKWFSGRKCLFLIDDVWKTDQNNYGYLPALRQLLSSSKESRMVISTRDKNIAGEAGETVEFGPRGNATSRKIFLGYFGSDASDPSSVENHRAESIDKILSICSGVPLVLGVAGRGARALKEAGCSAEDALDEYADILEQRQSNILEESPPDYGKDNEALTLRAAMDISLEHLNNRCKSAGVSYGMCIGEMYRALSVLKAQAWAPLSMLSKLWNVNRGDARRIVGQLCTMSLARWTYQTYKVIRSNEERTEGGLKIHDLQLEYCRQHCKELRSLHGKLLDRYLEVAVEESRAQVSDADVVRDGTKHELLYAEQRPWWSESMAEDGYLHAHVAWHLVKAEKRDELRGLLVDARWIKLRLVIGGIVTLENDFAELLRMDISADSASQGLTTESIDSEFRSILNALRCSWHYVAQNERELAVQLGGRLFDVQESSTAARKLVESAVRNSERPFAEARDAFLPDARSGQVNEVHFGGDCRSLSYSSCGKYIAVAAGMDVAVVEVDTLVEKVRFKGHKHYLSSVCFLPEPSKIISGSDGIVRVWDLRNPDDDALTLNGHDGQVSSVCASADGSRVASGSLDGTVRLWNVQEEASKSEEKRSSMWKNRFYCSTDDASGTREVGSAAYGCQVLRGHTDWVRCVCFSPDGALLASASIDGTVRLWNGHTGEYTGFTIVAHEESFLCVAFSPDGKLIASGSWDGTIRLWRADTGAATGILIDGHSGAVYSVAFSADGARIVSASLDLTVRVWSAESGTAIGAPLKGHTAGVNSALFSPDGARVASVSRDGTLRIWEPERAGDVSDASEGQWSVAQCGAISADGTRIALGHDGAICIWDTQSGRAVGGPLEGHTALVRCVAFSPDGALLASASDDKTVRLWNARAGAAVGGALEAHEHWVDEVLFSADGTKLLAYSHGNCRSLWSVPSGTLLWVSRLYSEDVPILMSVTEAQTAVEAILSESRPDASRETAAVYYDERESAVVMKRSQGDVRLATLPPLFQPGFNQYVWTYSTDRNEFVAVLADFRPLRLALHL